MFSESYDVFVDTYIVVCALCKNVTSQNVTHLLLQYEIMSVRVKITNKSELDSAAGKKKKKESPSVELQPYTGWLIYYALIVQSFIQRLENGE